MGGKRYVELYELVKLAREKGQVDPFEKKYMRERELEVTNSRMDRARKRRRKDAEVANRAPDSPRLGMCPG